MVRVNSKNIARFLNKNIAFVVAPILALLSIFLFNILSLLERDYPHLVHGIFFVVCAAFLFCLFYAVIGYIRTLPDEDDDDGR